MERHIVGKGSVSELNQRPQRASRNENVRQVIKYNSESYEVRQKSK